jgi:hypothetical protein
MPNLQDRMAEFKKAFESGDPPYRVSREAVESMHRATADLRGAARATLGVGDRAPDFTLFNQDRVEVRSADLFRSGPLVLSFFRGHW